MANEHIISNDVQISGSLNVSQSISASAFYGDGSNLLYVTASTQWNGILTGSASITGSLRVIGGDVDFRLSSGVSGSFSGSLEGNGAGITNLNLNGYQASGSNLSGSFSGSFIGNGSGLTGVTASFFSGSVLNSTSASYASTASYWSGSIASSSYAVSSSYAATASYWSGSLISAQTASYVNPLVQNVEITGSVSVTGSQTVTSTLQVTGKIQSETGVDILAPNGISFKNAPFNTTALGAVTYNSGIAFYSNGLVTPRMFISESGNIGIATTNPALGKLQVAGNVYALSFTGSILGTGSYALEALSASYATTSISASFANTSSHALQVLSASFASTASYYNTSLLTPITTFNTFTSSYNTGSFSGSFVGDGSGITGVTAEWDGSLTGDASITGSLTVTGIIAGGFFTGNGSGLTGIISPTAISASYAASASYADIAIFTSSSISASFAENSNTASIATSASYAASASYVVNAISASYATNAGTSNNSTSASYSITATSASFVASASYATTASYAETTGTAISTTSASYATFAELANTVDITDQPAGTGPYYPLFTDGTIDNKLYVDSTLYAYNATTNTLTVTASRAVTASHAINSSTASYYSGSVTSASYALTSSHAINSSTASYYNGSVISASYAQTASLAPGYLPLTGGTVSGDLTVTGNLTAQQYIVSSSVTYFTESFSSGSTRFGDTLDDTHQFTGSLSVTGSLTVTGSFGSSFININTPAISGRETLLTGMVSDNAVDKFQIANSTNVISRFGPTFVGYTGGTYTGLALRGLGDTVNDLNTSTAYLAFLAANTSNSADPNNGTLTAPTSRDLFTFGTTGVNYITVKAGGRVLIGTTVDNGTDRLQINGNVQIAGSLTQGLATTASGNYSHTEGTSTTASGNYSHAEGLGSVSSIDYAHAEGANTVASGLASHAEGVNARATENGAHAEGYFTLAEGVRSHAEGYYTSASGYYSHAEGLNTITSGTAAHAEGQQTTASGSYSHAEGRYTVAIGEFSHAEGDGTDALGYGSHAEGAGTVALGGYSHTEGNSCIASGSYSHAEGNFTIARGDYSHAEGNSTVASGSSSHAEGTDSRAIGQGSHAEGLWTVAIGAFQHTQGQYNITSSTQGAFIIGNGTDNTLRSNLVFTSGSEFQVTGSLKVTGSFVPPVMTSASRAALVTPATGSIVYQNDSITGLYVYKGSSWVNLTSSEIYIYAHNGFIPVASTNYYIGNFPDASPLTLSTSVRGRIIAQHTGQVVSAVIAINIATNGTGEASTFTLLNVTQATSAVISNAIVHSADSLATYTLASPLAVTEGDILQVQWTTPAWVTAPTTVRQRITTKTLVTN